MCRRFLAGFVFVAIAILAAAAQAEPRKTATVEGITEYQLDNGLKLLLFPDPSSPRVTVNMTVRVGSRHEGAGEGGMAHLLEHMVFKGTPTHPNPPLALRERGASFNGTTSDDRTNYFETLPASDENLEWALRFEADRLVNSFIRREDLISEMTVVRNEFERGENSPRNLFRQRIAAAAYDWHNYGKPTIGNRSDIERVPIERLQDFYKRYYQPDNAVVIVAGKFDEAKALEFTQKYFGAIPRPSRRLESTYTEEPPQDGERFVEVRRVGDVGLVGAVYHIPAGAHEDFAPLQLLASILSTPPAGRLYKALVETKKATSASAFASGNHDPTLLAITCEVPRENSLEEVRQIMLAVLDEVVAKGVTDEEVQRVKQQFLNFQRRAPANTSMFAVQLSNWIGQGDWRLYFVHRDRVEKVTASDVQRVAAAYLRPTNRTLGYFIPTEKPDLVRVPPAGDVEALVSSYQGRAPISAGEAFDYNYQNIEARTKRLALGGVKAAILPKKSRDEQVSLDLTLRFGNEENLRGYEEEIDVLPELMLRGTRRLSHQQLRDELTRLETRISANAQVGRITFSVNTRRPRLAEALNLLRQILREPALPAEELEILNRASIASLTERLNDPQSLATNLLRRTLNPYRSNEVRYVPTPQEQIERRRSVTIEQVRRLYEEFLGADDGELVIVGDFEPEPTLAAVAEMLSGWSAKQPIARVPRRAFTSVPGGKQTILTPDKASATYQAGLQVVLSDEDPEYAALVMGNYLLGGGGSLSSRLGNRVRQKEGLSYGVGSSLSIDADDKVVNFSMQATCNPANIGKLEAAMREEVERLLKEGVSQEEFDRAKEAYLRAQKQALASDNAVAGRLARSLELGRTLAFDEKLEKAIAAVTADQAIAALRKYIDPQRLVIITAGDFSSASVSP
jgi:zinc protease